MSYAMHVLTLRHISTLPDSITNMLKAHTSSHDIQGPLEIARPQVSAGPRGVGK